MIDFINNMSRRSDEFTNSQKTIAAYMKDNLDYVAFATLEDLASEVGFSTTTIIRFARALGYDGYSEMQKAVQENMLNKVSLPERFETERQIPDNELLKSSLENDIRNIEETFSSISEDALHETVQAISQAGSVYVLGMRSSFSLAHYMFSRIAQIRENVHLLQSTAMFFPEEMSSAREGDVCIAFLFPRYSKTTANIISWFRKYGIRIILFTSMDHTAVNMYGDIVLPCSILGISYKNSFAAPLCMINYIAAALASFNYGKTKNTLARTEEILNQGYYLGL